MAYQELAFPHLIAKQDASATTVLHLNARSACNKSDDIIHFLAQFTFKFNVIMISETWYYSNCAMLTLQGYDRFFINRPNKKGGGVALFVESYAKYELVHDYTRVTDDYEILTVKSKNRIISLVYRPPSGNVVTFFTWEFFEPFLDYVSMNNLKLVCGGDLNIDVLKQSNSSFQLNLCLQSAGFVNTITTPTRITSHTSSLLDLLIVDISTTVCNTGTLVSDISDHCPIFLIYTDDSKKTADACQQFTYQRITQASLEQFKNDVMNHNWSHVLNKTDANKAYNEFIRAFTHMYASNFPMKTAKHSKKESLGLLMSLQK